MAGQQRKVSRRHAERVKQERRRRCGSTHEAVSGESCGWLGCLTSIFRAQARGTSANRWHAPAKAHKPWKPGKVLLTLPARNEIAATVTWLLSLVRTVRKSVR